MAELLIDRWRLSVLRVRLDLESAPVVHSELTAYPAGQPEVLVDRRDEPEAYGIPSWSRGEVPPQLAVPSDLVDEVQDALYDRFGPEAALWIHLLEPRGYLGGVPWEAAFAPALEAPVLRVPNRLPTRIVPHRRYSIAVLASAAEPERIVAPLVGTIEQLANLVPLDVDLFADRGTRDVLDAHLGTIGAEVRVHDPDTAEACYEQTWHEHVGRRAATKFAPSAMPVPGPADVWTAWIAERAGDRPTSALHVFSDGRLDGDHGLVAVATDPARPVDRSTTGYLFADAVATIADRVGAETIAVTSLPGDPSELGVRLLTDVIGVNRPGPTIFVSGERDPGGDAAAAAHAFLADPEAPLPVHPGVFAYLQPERARRAIHEGDAPALMDYNRPPDVHGDDYAGIRMGVRRGDEVDVPAWVDPVERLIDRSLAELLPGGDVPVTKSTAKARYDEGREAALRDLRGIIQRHGGSY